MVMNENAILIEDGVPQSMLYLFDINENYTGMYSCHKILPGVTIHASGYLLVTGNLLSILYNFQLNYYLPYSLSY